MMKCVKMLLVVWGLGLVVPTLLCAAESGAPSDADLVNEQRSQEKDLERRVQSILDKVFGPNQSEVKASVNVSLQKQVEKRTGAGQQQKRREENPLGETKFILPGVPAPKNVSKEKEPENVEKQQAEQERLQSQVSFKINVSNREVLVFYNQKLKAKEPEARKVIIEVVKLKDNELKFVPGKFSESWATFWDDFVRDPKNLIYTALLFLLFLLLLWLFIPLTSFLGNLVRAMKEKGGIEVKMESQSEEDSMGGDGNKSPEQLAQEAALEAAKEGEEEMAKKYIPFDYISEENSKRLLGVFRKESPQVIALVLSYLKPELVRDIYKELPIELQTRVASEAAAVRQTSEEQVRIIDADIKAKIDFLVGGVNNLIAILEEVDYKIRDNILEYLKDHKPQLYEKVRGAIILFDDIPTFPDLAMQIIIRELKTDQLACALKNANPEVATKFYNNMSQGGAALLKEEMEFGRPVTDEQVEQARQLIMDTAKRLETENKVRIREKTKISIFESEDATSPLMPSLPQEESKGGFGAEPSAGAFQPGAQVQESAGAENVDVQSYLNYAEQLYNEGKYDEALPYAQQVTETDPNSAAAYQLMGHCYYGLSMMTEALQCYDYAVSLNPGDDQLKQWVEQFKQSVGA